MKAIRPKVETSDIPIAEAPRQSVTGLVRGDVQPRGEAVVAEILEATLEELAQVGYRALRVDTIAKTAGVNKTTVYRRWPTKIDLVKAALACIADKEEEPPLSGSVHTDLVNLALGFSRFALSVRGQSIVRVMFTERANPEMQEIVQSVRKGKLEGRKMALFDAAIGNSELPKTVDRDLILQMLFGSLHHRAFFLLEPIDEVWIRGLVDMLLFGAIRGAAQPRRRG